MGKYALFVALDLLLSSDSEITLFEIMQMSNCNRLEKKITGS